MHGPTCIRASSHLSSTLPTHAGPGHQGTIPTNKGHFRAILAGDREPLVATNAGTLHSLVANTSRCGEGIRHCVVCDGLAHVCK
jgi:hypothetical protein